MKKYLALVLAMLMVFSLCACGNDGSSNDDGEKVAYVLCETGDTYSQGLGTYFRDAFEADGGCKYECVSFRQRDISEEEQKRRNLEPSAVGGGVLYDAGSVGRDKVKISAGGNEEKQGRGEPCGAGDIRGTAAVGDGGAQSRLGGMVNGVPEAMDGFKLWEREPVGVPRITDRTDGRADRLKALGNAVCPPQVFPILKFISDIETGRCKKYCEFGGEQI